MRSPLVEKRRFPFPLWRVMGVGVDARSEATRNGSVVLDEMASMPHNEGGLVIGKLVEVEADAESSMDGGGIPSSE